MDITLLLAQIWGPILFSIAIGLFVSRRFYVKVYKDIESEPLAALTFAIFSMALGVIHVKVHNLWATPEQTLISVLGWALLIKGFVFAIVPAVANKGGKWAARSELLSAGAGIVFALGLYLLWFGYFGQI
jgi:hypothetical protein